MKIYTIVLMILMHVNCFAEENPFHLEEAFELLDAEDENLFSEMDSQQDSVDILPENTEESPEEEEEKSVENKRVVVEPKEKSRERNINTPEKHPKVPRATTPSVVIPKLIKIPKPIRVPKPTKIPKPKKRPKINKIEKDKENYILKIDLKKEKRLSRERLERDYRRAISEVQ